MNIVAGARAYAPGRTKMIRHQVSSADTDALWLFELPKKGRPRIEDRAKTIEARKPWLKLGKSRPTWYRRQAEKRKGLA
jgi:hypothetical protein